MATKKITELPLIQTISGSYSVVPIVIGNVVGSGTTDQISIENFSRFVTAYSAHTGSAGNTFTGPQTINNNVTINGKLTVTELVATYETASVIYSEGGNIFGNELTDKQELTGSVNITGSLIYNNVLVTNIDANTINRLQQTTASLNTFTSSQADRNLVLSTVTGSINQATASIQFQTASLLAFTASQDSRNFTLSQVTGSFNYFYQATASIQFQTASLLQFTASQDSRNFTLSQVTGSFNYFYQATASLQFHSASVEAQLARIQQATASLELASASFKYFYQSTASLQTFTASQADRNLVLSIVTGSINQATASLQFHSASVEAQLVRIQQATRSLELHSGSMVGVTNGLMAYTASNTTLNTGLRGEVDGIEAYTASLKGQAIVSSSTQVQNYDIFGLNSNLYRATGSLIGITNGLMAFTAALDNTYATDAQLYQLYQATASLQFQTASLLTFTASQDSRNFTLSQVTGSFRGEIGGIEAYTASLKTAAIVSSSTQVQNYDVFALNSNLYISTGSLIGITNGIMALTASMKNSTIVSSSNQIPELFRLMQTTASLNTLTGSMSGVVNGIMALTASMKASAIVSSSQQVQNYFTFAKTGSVNTFYGNQTITGSVFISGSIIPNVGVGFTSSFSLGSSTNAWGDIWVGNGSLKFVQPNTGATASIKLDANNQLSLDKVSFTKGAQITGSLTVESPLLIGDKFQGGKIAYILKSGDAGYDPTLIKGIIAAESDEPFTGLQNWYAYTSSIDAKTTNGYTDWYLPTISELNYLYTNRVAIGGFTTNFYFSTTEYIDGTYVFIQNFNTGAAGSYTDKTSTSYYARAIRSFSIPSNILTVIGRTVFSGSLDITGSLKVGDWQHGVGVANNAKLDIRTASDRGLKVTGGPSSDVIITAYRGASDDMVRSMRLEASDINIYTGDGNANTGSYIGGFNTNGLAFAAGKGIDFSATSNGSGTTTSELLNDYEEGTWTPTLTSDTAPSGVTYSTRLGKYTKIGRVVHIEFVIGLTSKGTGTGDSFITGLPFTVVNDMGAGEPACVNISLCQGLSTSVYVVAGWADNGSTNIQLRKTTAASTSYPQNYMTTTDISDSLYIQGNATYHV